MQKDIRQFKNFKPWHIPEIKEEMFNEIVARITNGESLVSVCNDENFKYPSPAAFLSWVRDNPIYAKRYAQAAKIRADVNAELIVHTAQTEDNVPKARNIMDALKWHNSKMDPIKYGEKYFSENQNNVNIKTKIDFSAIPSQVREQMREALLKQLGAPTIDATANEIEE